jgi:hypothetical protein
MFILDLNFYLFKVLRVLFLTVDKLLPFRVILLLLYIVIVREWFNQLA